MLYYNLISCFDVHTCTCWFKNLYKILFTLYMYKMSSSLLMSKSENGSFHFKQTNVVNVKLTLTFHWLPWSSLNVNSSRNILYFTATLANLALCYYNSNVCNFFKNAHYEILIASDNKRGNTNACFIFHLCSYLYW